MNIHSMPLGLIQANCYICENSEKQAIIIDIGGEAYKLTEYINQNKITPLAVLLTHGHFDHMTGVEDFQKDFDVSVYIHKSDEICLKSAVYNVSETFDHPFVPHIKNVKFVTDGETLNFGDELVFKVIHTPGHTEGGVCYDTGTELFSGDTMFKHSFGRTDMPGGSEREIISSLKKICNIDGDRKVYPGHGESTVLSEERKIYRRLFKI